MVFRLAGEIIAFLYRRFLPSLKRGLIPQDGVLVAATIRAINSDFVWKFAATVVSQGSSLCPGPCSDPQGRSENGVETCGAGSRKTASHRPWRITSIIACKPGSSRDALPRDPAPHVRGRYQPDILARNLPGRESRK